MTVVNQTALVIAGDWFYDVCKCKFSDRADQEKNMVFISVVLGEALIQAKFCVDQLVYTACLCLWCL